MLKVLLVTVIVIVALFVLLFGVYFFNLDMKLIRKIYDMLGKHYDNIEKDRKL